MLTDAGAARTTDVPPAVGQSATFLAAVEQTKAVIRTRIGVVIVPGRELNTIALRYLLLHVNTLQAVLQFEVYPYAPQIPWLRQFTGNDRLNRAQVRDAARSFASTYRDYVASEVAQYNTKEAPPRDFVIVTRAKFSDNFFSTREGDVAVLALGDWERHMAPPSILEFIVTLVARPSTRPAHARSAGH